jgi:hypothetical protein
LQRRKLAPLSQQQYYYENGKEFIYKELSLTNILQSIRKLKASMSVLVGDDRKVIDMIKHQYLKESVLASCDETR